MSTSGSDSNSGTQTSPFRTIGKASQVAKPGTTIHVAPGTYAGTITTSASGTASERIRYVSDTKWGAKIVPSSSSVAAWTNRGNYVEINGFDIDGQSGSQWRNGILERGSNNIIKNNRVHHIADKVACDSNGGSAINTSNVDHGQNIDVIGNVVHNMGFAGCNHIHGIYMATSGQVRNNLVYGVGAVAIHLWHDAAKINITNNTVFGSTTGILVGGGDFYHSSGGADYVNVTNNIVFDNSKHGIREYGTLGKNNTYTNNLSYGNGTNWYLLNGQSHTGDINADPQFVSYSRSGGGDYRLKSTSPAIDKGLKTYAPSTDINGAARPQGGGVDLGAYEHTGS